MASNPFDAAKDGNVKKTNFGIKVNAKSNSFGGARFVAFVLLSLSVLFGGGGTLAVAQDSTPLDEWHWRNPLPQGNPLGCVVFAENRFLALGDARTAFTSSDGESWSPERAEGHWGDDVSCSDLIFSKGIYVASIQRHMEEGLMISTDGLRWERVFSGDLRGLAFGDDTFVAVGSSIATSPDGRRWNAVAQGPSPLSAVTHGANRFVAVGFRGAIMTSTDSVAWQTVESGTSANLGDVAHGAGSFVAVGAGGLILRSADGQEWRRVGSPVDAALLSVSYDGSRFVAVGEAGAILTSSDGRDWRRQPNRISAPLWDLAIGGGRYVAVGDFGAIATSGDARRWELATTSVTYAHLRDLAGDGQRIVAVGGAGTVLTSEDGVRWRARNSGTERMLRGVVHDRRQFVAVGDAGTILTSPNGVGWAPRRSGTSENLHDVAFGNGLYVAVGTNGRILTSRDGRTWRSRESGVAETLSGVAFGGGRFVAVASQWNTVVTSTDGVNWTRVRVDVLPDQVELEFLDITYGDGRFVAVGREDQYSGGVVVSEDGVNWERGQGDYFGVFPEGWFNGVTHSHGTFLVVGSIDAIFSATDGREWQRHLPQTVNRLDAALFGSGAFITVGRGGTILQSAPYLAARPAFSVRGGTYRQPQHVTITTRTEGATIRYTTDGRLPSCTRGTEIVSGGFVTIERDSVLQAVACAEGYGPSELRKETYRIRPRR